MNKQASSSPSPESQQLSESQKSKKRLPEIPPEELAKYGHGDRKVPHELPPDVQAQFRRRQFRKSTHERSRSLSGIEGMELYKQEEETSQPSPSAGQDSENENLAPSVNNNAVSVPNTPGRPLYIHVTDSKILLY
jgi:hypothetical protein